MAITAIFDMPGVTAEQYDEVMKRLDGAGAGAPAGRLHHVASPNPTGWLVVDVWASEAELGAFAGVLMPIFGEVGINPPTPEVLPAHNIVRG